MTMAGMVAIISLVQKPKEEKKSFAAAEGAVLGVANDLWADIVLGKRDFGEIGPGKVVPNKLLNAGGVIVDRSVSPNRMYVWDSGNNRILGINLSTCVGAGNCPVTLVIGQPSGTDYGACNQDSSFSSYEFRKPASASTICGINEWTHDVENERSSVGMYVDASGNLYAPDFRNNRILKYNSPFTTDTVADEVWGQPDFASNGCNGMTKNALVAGGYTPIPPPTASTLCASTIHTAGPTTVGYSGDGGVDGFSVTFDNLGNMWVADGGNSRILRFPKQADGTIAKTANAVLGKSDFTSGYYNGGTILDPIGIVFDSAGNLYVAGRGAVYGVIYKFPLAQSLGNNSSILSGEVFYQTPTNTTGLHKLKGMVKSKDGLGMWVAGVPSQYLDSNLNTLLHNVSFAGVRTGTSGINKFGTGGSIGEDTAGNLYFTTKSDVYKYTPTTATTGTFTSMFEITGTDPGIAQNRFGGYSSAGLSLNLRNTVAVSANQVFVTDGRLMFWNRGASATIYDALSSGKSPDGCLGSCTDLTTYVYGASTVDSSGRLWVARNNKQSGVWVKEIVGFNSITAFTSTTAPSYTIPNTVNRADTGTIAIDQVESMATTSDGKLWVANRGASRVVRISNPTTSPVVDAVIGASSSQLVTGFCDSTYSMTGLCWPSGIGVDKYNNLYVADNSYAPLDSTTTPRSPGNYRMMMFAPVNPAAGTVVFAPTAIKEFPKEYNSTPKPDSLSLTNYNHYSFQPAFDSANHMVVGNDPNAKRWVDYYIDPKKVNATNPRDPLFAKSDGQLADFYGRASSVAFDAQNNLYVYDTDRSKIMIYKTPNLSIVQPTVTPILSPTPTRTPTPTMTTSPTPMPNNIAPLADTIASSEYNQDYPSSNTIDNIIGEQNNGEWASAGEQNPWIQLTWSASKTINSVVLYDRATIDDATAGTLTFSDQSSIPVTGIPADGTTGKVVSFANKNVTWVKFQVTAGTGPNVGLSELQVIENSGPTSTPTRTPTPSIIPPSPTPTGNILVLPNMGSTAMTTRPIFDWPDAVGATSYTIQVALTSTFTTPLVNVAVTSSTYTQTVDLPPNKLLYWHVRSVGPSGTSPWSTLYRFTSANPPTVPVQSLPASAATVSTAPTLTWVASTSNPVRYEVQVATDTLFTNIVASDSNITTTAWTVLPALASTGMTHYWRVRAYAVNGHYSTWSLVRNFKPSLPAPTLSSPINGATDIVTTRPTFDWSDVTGATGYTIQVALTNTFATPTINAAILTPTSTYTPIIDLPKGKLMYWRVQGRNGTLLGTWSTVSTFTSANPPTSPVLQAPLTNSISLTTSPLLKWTAPTLAPLASRYQVQISTVSTFASTVLDNSNVTTNSFTVSPALSPNTTYYWRVRSYAANGHYSTWSTTFILKTSLAAPTLSTPTNNATDIVTTRPTFDWSDVTGATGYTIQVALTNTFATPTINAAILTPTSTYTPIIDLPKGKPMYWRVKSNGGLGASDYSPTFSFTSANPPTSPVLTAPINGSLAPTNPLLKWTAPTITPLASRYQVQISTVNTFTSTVLDDSNVTTNSLTVSSALTTGLTYYWRVRSYAANGHYSTWSAAFSFKTTLNPPTLSSPINGATDIVTTRPTFDWSDVTGATGYTIQVALTNTFATPTINAAILTPTSTYTPIIDLPKGKLMYWRVQGRNGTLLGTWSTVSTFTSANPPTSPVLQAPLTNSISLTTSPLLKWTAPTLAPLASRYQVQISTVSTFASTVLDNSNVTTNSFTVSPALSPNTTYYWRVRSYAANGHYSTWSTTFILKTSLAAPTLSTPTNNATDIVTTRPTFDWSDVTGATGYTIQVALTNTFATPTINAAILTPTSTYTPIIDLPKGKPMYWRVKSNGGLGASDYSPTFSFTSANPPTVPTAVSPLNGASLSSYPPTLDWSDSVGLPVTHHYEIQIATNASFATDVGVESTVNNVSKIVPNYTFRPGASFYWRVRSYAANGHYSNWSVTFRMNVAPSAPFSPPRM